MALLPNVPAALAAGGFCSYASTRSGPGGDLLRLLGMRAVAVFSVIRGVDADVGMWSKATIMARKFFSALIFWDQKYQVSCCAPHQRAGTELAYCLKSAMAD